MRKRLLHFMQAAAFAAFAGSSVFGWDYEAHRVISEVALGSLPTNFPSFVRQATAAERVAFLAGEADRWRNVQDLPLRHVNGPDHYIDVEDLQLYGLNPATLPPLRSDFIAQLALIRAKNPDRFKELLSARNEDHTRELLGLLPWAIAEQYSKLKACFAYLRAFEEDGGRPEEIENARANIVYVMGVMGHFVGDASQPLHTTIHHHGWVGENPNGYTTNSRIHSWIDGGYMAKLGGADASGLRSRSRPAQVVMLDGRPAKPEEMFQAALTFVLEQHKTVLPFYQMEKQGKFSGDDETGREGKAFLESQMLKSAQFLGDLWCSAWQQAPPDTFLKAQLAKRKVNSKN